MDVIRKTPIILITGSLGSGKTTLLRHILESAVREIIEAYGPDFIVVEATGVAESDAILRTVNCGVEPDPLFGQAAIERPRPVPSHADERHSSAGATDKSASPAEKLHSFAWTTEKTLRSAKFDELIRDLPLDLIRAKGFVRFEDGGRLFNYVVGRADFEEFSVDGAELVFIGRNLDRFRLEIEERLRDCEAE